MGCIGSREGNMEQSLSKQTNLQMLLTSLSQGQFVESIIIQSSVLNYYYSKQRKVWMLKKKKLVHTIDSLIPQKQQCEIRNYFSSFADTHNESQILLRPIRNFRPTFQLYEVITALQKNDTLPPQLLIKYIDAKHSQIINFSNNGKYTILLQIHLYNIASLKQFYRFQQILQVKITKILKFVDFEFFGLISLNQTDKINDLQKFIDKYGWNIKFIDISKNQQVHSLYFNGYQVFNCIDEDGRINVQDAFYIIDPKGIVLRSEIPEFYVQKKNDQQVYSDEFDEVSSQKSKALSYERKLLKDLHLHHAFYISKNKGSATQPITKQPSLVQEQLTKYSIIQQQILQQLETISENQYKDFKNLFQSARLYAILCKYHPGEPFQFELVKQKYFNFNFSNQTFELKSKVVLLPTIFPTASNAKQKVLIEICRQLRESIGLKWKDPDLSVYSIPHQFTFNKIDFMEFLTDFTSNTRYKLKFYFLKKRQIQWQSKYFFDSDTLKPIKYDLALSIGPQPKPIWINEINGQFIFSDQYELHNQPIDIGNIKNLHMIKSQLENLSQKLKILKLNFSHNGLVVLKKYLYKGFDYEIQIGQKILIFTDEFKIDQESIILVIKQFTKDSFQQILNKYEDLLQQQSNIKLQIIYNKNYTLNEKDDQQEILQLIQQNPKVQLHYLNEQWDKENNLQFQQDIKEKYFGITTEAKLFQVNQDGYITNIMGQQEFLISTTYCQLEQNQPNSFISQNGFIDKEQETNWKKIKQNCYDFNQYQEEQCQEINKQIQNELQLQIKSQKCQIWDEHNYNFKEFCTIPTISHNLNKQQLEILIKFLPNLTGILN